MNDHLGVGLGDKLIAQPLELGAQLFVVFYDAVVYHRQTAGDVGVGIGFGRLTVGGPAGVGNVV